MTGVRRGAQVAFTTYRDSAGRDQTATVAHVGTVLDRAADAGCWWVSSSTTGAGGAVLVKASAMAPAKVMH